MPDTLRILVVDDYPDGRQLLAEYLQFRGFSVLTASSGREAIDVAAQVQPAAILMDLRMPGMDGWEATRLLRANPATSDVMIVAVTAAALADEVCSALDAGCDAVVAKPYDLTALADALSIALVEGPDAFKFLGATGQPGSESRRGATARHESRARGARAVRS
jgi:two-component system, cell cycle response regulator DivK